MTRAEPPKAGDVVDDPVLGPTPLISVYLRQDAMRDGVLVDCTQGEFDKLNGNAGIMFDVAMTETAFVRYVDVPENAQQLQDVDGRYWDILSKFVRAAALNPNAHEILFDFLSIPNGTGTWDNERPSDSSQYRLVQLKAVSGPGDRGEPCLTFMLPTED